MQNEHMLRKHTYGRLQKMAYPEQIGDSDQVTFSGTGPPFPEQVLYFGTGFWTGTTSLLPNKYPLFPNNYYLF